MIRYKYGLLVVIFILPLCKEITTKPAIIETPTTIDVDVETVAEVDHTGEMRFCTKNGVRFEAGDVWHPLFLPQSYDSCSKCHCFSDGNVLCSDIDCPDTVCRGASIPIGRCCPICPVTTSEPLPMDTTLPENGCYQDGYVYRGGQPIIFDVHKLDRGWPGQSCTHCVCSNGAVECKEKHCPLVSCSDVTYSEDDCCPICIGHPDSGAAVEEEESDRIAEAESPDEESMIIDKKIVTEDDGAKKVVEKVEEASGEETVVVKEVKDGTDITIEKPVEQHDTTEEKQTAAEELAEDEKNVVLKQEIVEPSGEKKIVEKIEDPTGEKKIIEKTESESGKEVIVEKPANGVNIEERVNPVAIVPAISKVESGIVERSEVALADGSKKVTETIKPEQKVVQKTAIINEDGSTKVVEKVQNTADGSSSVVEKDIGSGEQVVVVKPVSTPLETKETAEVKVESDESETESDESETAADKSGKEAESDASEDLLDASDDQSDEEEKRSIPDKTIISPDDEQKNIVETVVGKNKDTIDLLDEKSATDALVDRLESENAEIVEREKLKLQMTLKI